MQGQCKFQFTVVAAAGFCLFQMIKFVHELPRLRASLRVVVDA